MLRRAGSVTYPERFTLVDRPDAPGLQRCFTDEVPVTVAVDRAATDGQLVGWIEVTAQDPSEVREMLLQAVGPSVAAYVSGFELPESPGVTASGARESAASIALRDDGTVRAVIERLASVDAGDEDDGREELVFTVDFVFDDAGRVVSIAARPSIVPGSTADEEESFGYVLEYDWSAGAQIELPDPATITPARAVVDAIVVPIRSAFECSIGG